LSYSSYGNYDQKAITLAPKLRTVQRAASLSTFVAHTHIPCKVRLPVAHTSMMVDDSPNSDAEPAPAHEHFTAEQLGRLNPRLRTSSRVSYGPLRS
jgi:hypothetical protein